MIQKRGLRAALLTLSGSIMLLGAVPVPVRAQAPIAELQVNAFSGASNLPVWIAQHEGMFARRGIAVTLSSPKGSVDQFKGLVAGRYPVVVTAFDNVVAYHSGRGAAEIGAIPDFVAVMGIDRGLLTLVASPGIRQIADLKGQTLAVDALSTGFSFALKEILLKAGVNGTDVSFITAGNTAGRWQAMQEKKAVAALLTLPADLEAVDHGSIALTTVASSFGDYLGNVVALRQGWAAAHRAELNAFLSGVSDAMAWLDSREHKARAIEILHTEMPTLDADKLERVYDALMDSNQGLIRSGVINPEGARTVLSLHAKYADSTQGLQSPETYYDTRYLDAALVRK
jgi:ABC-type nitrate/sulfonate/bicarbonate transport system substrate-binding protein